MLAGKNETKSNPKLGPKSRDSRELFFYEIPGLDAMETLFETMNDTLFCVKDLDRRYVTANWAFLKRAGMKTRKDLIGRTASEVFPALLAAGYEQQDVEVFTKGIVVRDRLELITQSDGGMGWFLSQKVPIKNKAEKVVGLAGISREIGKPSNDLGTLAAIIDTIYRDYSKPIRIEELADQSGYSWSQFERKIRAITGVTPRGMLTKVRIEQAAQMLIHSDQSIASISHDCGFYDQASFSRQFRSATGLSPKSYRNEFRQQMNLD